MPAQKTPRPQTRILIVVLLCLLINPSSAADSNPTNAFVWDTMPDTWAAVDDLGRSISENSATGNLRTNKILAMFYYTWHGYHGEGVDSQGNILDNSILLAKHPDLVAAPWDTRIWDSLGCPSPDSYYWAQPLFGYYSFHDPDEWVIRKHCQMLADAGVDVLIFDASNGVTYDAAYQKIFEVCEKIRAVGGKAPQLAFFTYANSSNTIQKLYENYYAHKAFSNLWFYWHGKPLILGDPNTVSVAGKNFFIIRNCWAFPSTSKTNWWWWTDNYPQHPGLGDKGKFEEMSIAVDNGGMPTEGRSWNHQSGSPAWPGPYPNSDRGPYLAEQWNHAKQADPQMLFITQWNEWTAGRWQRTETFGAAEFLGHKEVPGDSYFVDEFNPEFSRDLEPMKGGFGDDFYWQFVDVARQFKGTRPLPPASAPMTIKLNDFNSWTNVGPEYRDDIGDIFHRNGVSAFGKITYVDDTGHNDFKLMKVARDAKNLCFYAQTATPISSPSGTNWMNLFIGVENSAAPAWQKFQFLIRPQNNFSNAQIVLQTYTGNGTNWSWSAGQEIPMALNSNGMALSIPRNALGLEVGQTSVDIRFKWADNMQSGSPLDWFLHGDTAPNERFAYRYRASIPH
jgi:hypothetical protein